SNRCVSCTTTKAKAEKMEANSAKRIKKKEKAKKKAAKMMMECKDSSSSKSPSSLESDGDNVMNIKEIKTKKTSKTGQETPLSLALPVQIYEKVENKVNENTMLKDLTLVEEGSKKIKVCMRGKCKKSGATMLMENFQTTIGWKVILMLPSFIQMLVKASNGCR
nr:thioredoxin-like fold protein [Tanacetum cinerariifolium]